MKDIAILINVRDRPTELVLLLQSLRTQSYQDFDIFILDDQSGTQLINYQDIPEDTNRKAKYCFIDWLGAVYAAYQYPLLINILILQSVINREAICLY